MIATLLIPLLLAGHPDSSKCSKKTPIIEYKIKQQNKQLKDTQTDFKDIKKLLDLKKQKKDTSVKLVEK